MKSDIHNFSFDELEKWIIDHGYPKYRGQQIFSWIYKKYVVLFSEMKNIPPEMQKILENNFELKLPHVKKKQVSELDNTVKYLFQLSDNEFVESAVIPAGERLTMCLSTQVGCRFRCKFCASGILGLKRNMQVGEIVSQLLIAEKEGYKITNIVFMGTGEPLDNFENLSKTINIINDKNGINIGARKITVSTSGITEGIEKLSELGMQIELSISLHAANNKKRDELMPINKLYPIEKVLDSVKRYIECTNRVVTFEYILLKNVNDTFQDLQDLIKLLSGLKCKVNLIPFSPLKDLPYETPEPRAVKSFCDALNDAGIQSTIRISKGVDISAACGQLRIQNF